ncbi:hypothetical protein SBA2_450048 [Acidobacteriia bacterium SbA2]|nr:hypothetical protein SBA2_450048 [Acidobacteriia bacterium SbA2]
MALPGVDFYLRMHALPALGRYAANLARLTWSAGPLQKAIFGTTLACRLAQPTHPAPLDFAFGGGRMYVLGGDETR